ncbi:hypothetical protein [Chitinolyticbacter albus]|uniref:hypothetical protein n=1 Tax=Chitinolyticbacter albus TaxID=2961951 RepID=UPI00210D926E|nr:hypothetical protein [Chitinolyticbacter albus]
MAASDGGTTLYTGWGYLFYLHYAFASEDGKQCEVGPEVIYILPITIIENHRKTRLQPC